MHLYELIKVLNIKKIFGSMDYFISDISCDSRKVKAGDMFVCIRGSNKDGHKYVWQAILAGAIVIVSEEWIKLPPGRTLIIVPDTSLALGMLSDRFFDYPEDKLVTIGITGTKGKTSTSYILKAILEKAGFRPGIIGTIEIFDGRNRIDSKNTTPDAYDIHKYIKNMVDNGCTHAILEVSSQGLKYNRVTGMLFDYGIFTNISPDHIGKNEHCNFKDYLYSKGRLLSNSKTSVINLDDDCAGFMRKKCRDKVVTFGFDGCADFTGSDLKLSEENETPGITFNINEKQGFFYPVPGKFGALNVLAATACARQMRIQYDTIKEALKNVKIRGRMEHIKAPEGFGIIIDYAHNALSMENVLYSVRMSAKGQIICVFGCGGNRSRYRRFDMGEIAGKLADFTIVTEDNSRNENVLDIIKDIKVGLNNIGGKYEVVPDRRKAIEYAMGIAKKDDMILLLGKGHENYQEHNGIREEFDERKIVLEIINSKNNKKAVEK